MVPPLNPPVEALQGGQGVEAPVLLDVLEPQGAGRRVEDGPPDLQPALLLHRCHELLVEDAPVVGEAVAHHLLGPLILCCSEHLEEEGEEEDKDRDDKDKEEEEKIREKEKKSIRRRKRNI